VKIKIKNYMEYFRGFMKTSTLIVILAFLLIFYFWHVQIGNYIGEKYDASKDNGAIFYLTGIWNKTRGITQLVDSRSQRALELAGSSKKIADKTGRYSFEILESWITRKSEGILGNQLSRIVIESSNFTERRVGEDIFYDNGAQFTIQEIKGEQPSAKLADGGYGSNLIKKIPTDIGGQAITYFFIKENNVKSGEIIVAHIIHGGNTFNFRYVFNSKMYNGGEYSFQEILHSFKFNDKK
jgi:hypothetical protein